MKKDIQKLAKERKNFSALHIFLASVMAFINLGYIYVNSLGMQVAADQQQLVALGRRVDPLRHSSSEYGVLLALAVATAVLAATALILLLRTRPSFSWRAVGPFLAAILFHALGHGLLDDSLFDLLAWPAFMLAMTGCWYYLDSVVRKADDAHSNLP